jgi:hypothetical protein
MSSPGTTKREFLWPCNVGDQRPTASEGNSPQLTHYLKSLDLACLQPKPCDLAIGKTALKFDFSLIGDRQVIANKSFGVSCLMFKRRVRLPLGHRSVQSRHRVLRSLHGN